MINLEELKNEIENNSLAHSLVIYKCAKGSEFIPHQYVLNLRNLCGYEIQHVDNVDELPKESLFTTVDFSGLTILTIDKLDEVISESNNRVWVICNKIDNKVKKECDDCIVEVPKLEEWQVRDFISSYCDVLSESQIDELYEVYKNNLFRLDNELHKIKLIGNYEQIKSQLYTDISNYNVFDIVNSIVRRDRVSLSNIYRDIDCIDIEPFGLLTLLINNFRHVIDIQLARNATDESVGVSSRQFWAIKNYSCGHYSKDELVYIYKLLTEIDYKVKSGKLDTSMLINYIICKILTL